MGEEQVSKVFIWLETGGDGTLESQTPPSFHLQTERVRLRHQHPSRRSHREKDPFSSLMFNPFRQAHSYCSALMPSDLKLPEFTPSRGVEETSFYTTGSLQSLGICTSKVSLLLHSSGPTSQLALTRCGKALLWCLSVLAVLGVCGRL